MTGIAENKINEMEMELGRRQALYDKIIKDEGISDSERDFYRGKAACLTDMMYLLIKYSK